MAITVLMVEVSGGRIRGTPRLGWMDGVKVAWGSRGTTVDAERQFKKDRKKLSTCSDRVSRGHFCFFPVFFWAAHSRSGGLSAGDGWDAVT